MRKENKFNLFSQKKRLKGNAAMKDHVIITRALFFYGFQKNFQILFIIFKSGKKSLRMENCNIKVFSFRFLFKLKVNCFRPPCSNYNSTKSCKSEEIWNKSEYN